MSGKSESKRIGLLLDALNECWKEQWVDEGSRGGYSVEYFNRRRARLLVKKFMAGETVAPKPPKPDPEPLPPIERDEPTTKIVFLPRNRRPISIPANEASALWLAAMHAGKPHAKWNSKRVRSLLKTVKTEDVRAIMKRMFEIAENRLPKKYDPNSEIHVTAEALVERAKATRKFAKTRSKHRENYASSSSQTYSFRDDPAPNDGHIYGPSGLY